MQVQLLALLLLAPLAAAQSSPEASADESTRRPNIVLFLVDDLGWTDLGCQGSDLYLTPNIDRLAASGLVFDNAYAAGPVCSPSRAAIQTGKSPARLHITDWIPGVRYPHARLATPEFAQQVGLDELTLAEALAGVGYRCLHVGKWHLGSEPYYPLEQGYHVNIGGHSKGAPGSYFHPYAKQNKETDWTVRNLPPGGEEGDYLTDRLTDEALKLIGEQADEPFFLHMSYYAVHTPIEGKPELVERYRAELQGRGDPLHTNPTYAAMVQSVDESVGRILGRLEELGLDEHTAVLFTSDNGGVEGVTRNDPLRAYKGFLYEGGIREPFFVRWPGVTAPGGRSSEPVIGTDLYPTLLSIAGAVLTEEQREDLDGINLEPLFSEPGLETGRQALCWHYPHYHTPRRPPCSAIRRGELKLIHFWEEDRDELYDLTADPGELHDLARERPEQRAALRAALDTWLVEHDAQLPATNPDFDPERPFRGGYTAWEE